MGYTNANTAVLHWQISSQPPVIVAGLTHRVLPQTVIGLLELASLSGRGVRKVAQAIEYVPSLVGPRGAQCQ